MVVVFIRIEGKIISFFFKFGKTGLTFLLRNNIIRIDRIKKRMNDMKNMKKKIILTLVLALGISGIESTAVQLNKSFCGGSRGAVFSKSAPLVAEGRI